MSSKKQWDQDFWQQQQQQQKRNFEQFFMTKEALEKWIGYPEIQKLVLRDPDLAELLLRISDDEEKFVHLTSLIIHKRKQRENFLKENKLHIVIKINKSEPIYEKITARLPEDYRSDLFQLRERWQKKGLSPKEIEYLTYKHLIHIIFGLIQVKIQNFFLFRYSSNKDN